MMKKQFTRSNMIDIFQFNFVSLLCVCLHTHAYMCVCVGVLMCKLSE